MQCRILVASCCVCFLGAAGWCSAQSDRKARRELQSAYPDWLDNDVAYIITDAEPKAFAQLSNAEERERFIEQFWMRRDPTPDTDENEFKKTSGASLMRTSGVSITPSATFTVD
jgi:hypothetical protein